MTLISPGSPLPPFSLVLFDGEELFSTLGPYETIELAHEASLEEVKHGFRVEIRDSNNIKLASTEPKPKPRGFAANPELARTAGRKGGLNVPAEKRSFSANRELAKSAGKKGGHSVPAEKRSFAVNPQLAQAAGRKIKAT